MNTSKRATNSNQLYRLRTCFAWLFTLTVLLGPVAMTSGCSRGKQLVSSTTVKRTVKIKLKPRRDTNGGRPVHLLIREVDRESFVGEDYDAVASKVVDRDPSVLASVVLFAGQAKIVKVDAPKKGKRLAVYAFFTKPDADWKQLFSHKLPKKLVVILEDNRIRSARGVGDKSKGNSRLGLSDPDARSGDDDRRDSFESRRISHEDTDLELSLD
ncbi:MAG: hypothetical protein AAGC55_26655 [Myxococcota bacterium]